jgi:DNA gyrase/topoisomerase IV subunit A
MTKSLSITITLSSVLKQGMIKKTIVEAFSRPRANGINAITINEGDQLAGS